MPSDDGLDELPPEMAAAWRAREAEERGPEGPPSAPEPDRSAAVPPAPPEPDDAVVAQPSTAEDGLQPGDEGPVTVETGSAVPPRSVEKEGRRPRRGSLALAFLVVPLLLAVIVAVRAAGLAGWRGGPVAVTVGLVIVALALGFGLTRGLPRRGAYVAGALVIALVGAAWSVSSAPLSHGRLEDILDSMPTGGAVPVSTTRSGHGWCRPRCPTVTRTYRVAGRRPAAAMQAIVAAMDRGGLIPRDAGRVAYSRSFNAATATVPVRIDNQRYFTVVRVEPDAAPEAAGGSRVEVEITSRRGTREKPLSPARAR